mgnify:CR=1 FL=1
MTKTEWRQEVRGFTAALVAMKDQAGRLGLWRTMHAIDEATRAIGYETADVITGKPAWTGLGAKPYRQRRRA